MIKLIIAFILFVLGCAWVADWIIFATQKENEQLPWHDFRQKYIARFPEAVQPLVNNAVLITFVCILCFVVAGIIFINQKRRAYTVLAILAFVLAAWQLFSLM